MPFQQQKAALEGDIFFLTLLLTASASDNTLYLLKIDLNSF